MSAAQQLVARIADQLADPEQVQRRHRRPGWWRHALASGALGIALLHVERARTGHAPWTIADDWLTYATAQPVPGGPGCHLHHGAPALATVLLHASAHRPGRYDRPLAELDEHLAAHTTGRVDAAHRRIDIGHPPALAEFDLLRGLTGLGTYWVHRTPDHPVLRDLLGYLVRLTEPRPDGRPGWWTHLAPDGRRTVTFPGGHVNHGLSHGIAGPLALLALAHRAGIHVPDHVTALQRILAWLDEHQHHTAGAPWWPYWTVPGALHAPRPGRPSWCYGTPGIARAQQLAGLALDDPARVRAAEHALHTAVADPDLHTRLGDAGLCHGSSGVLLLTRRAATDSPHADLTGTLATLHRDLLASSRLAAATAPDAAPELLAGAAGIALALHDHDADHATTTRWDTCLLTS